MTRSNMNSNRSTSRRRDWAMLLLRTVMVSVIVMILGLAAVPLLTNSGRDAPWAEAEQLLGSLRDRARVDFAQKQRRPTRLTDFADEPELEGMYYRALDRIYLDASPPQETQPISEHGYARLVGVPQSEDGQWLVMTFAWSDGQVWYEWLDDEPDWLNE